MDAATWLSRRREIGRNLVPVLRKCARVALKPDEKRLRRPLDIGVSRSHRVQPFVATFTRSRNERRPGQSGSRTTASAGRMLYKEFIEEASHCYVHALQHNEPDLAASLLNPLSRDSFRNASSDTRAQVAAPQMADSPVRYAMKRELLTHAQRREQTRERLLAAARTMFVKKGLAATSVEDIAEAAGYTRGAFYSNFGGKPELLIELLRCDDERARASLQAIMEEGGTPSQMKARAIAYYSQYLREHDCFPLWVEAKLLAWRNTGFQERFNAFRHEKLDQLRAYVHKLSTRDGRPMPLQADALALGLLSLCDGVQFSRMCDPQMVSDEVMQAVISGFFSCALS